MNNNQEMPEDPDLLKRLTKANYYGSFINVCIMSIIMMRTSFSLEWVNLFLEEFIFNTIAIYLFNMVIAFVIFLVFNRKGRFSKTLMYTSVVLLALFIYSVYNPI
jgi:hypothetical protein